MKIFIKGSNIEKSITLMRNALLQDGRLFFAKSRARFVPMKRRIYDRRVYKMIVRRRLRQER
jgi:hypothetical protein